MNYPPTKDDGCVQRKQPVGISRLLSLKTISVVINKVKDFLTVMATEIVPDEENPMLLKPKKTVSIDEDDTYSKIFPELNGDFSNIFEKTGNKTAKRLKDARVKPYISIVDLNNDEETPYENKPKRAFEIGVSVSF